MLDQARDAVQQAAGRGPVVAARTCAPASRLTIVTAPTGSAGDGPGTRWSASGSTCWVVADGSAVAGTARPARAGTAAAQASSQDGVRGGGDLRSRPGPGQPACAQAIASWLGRARPARLPR